MDPKRTSAGGQINYTTERSLRLADLPQPSASADPQHPFFGQTFCFTGELHSFSRLDAMAAVAERGATNRQSVTKKTSYVVIGRSDPAHSASASDLGESGKERKALEYMALGQQINVLGEREFLRILGGATRERAALPLKPVPSAALPDAKPKFTAAATGRPAPVRTVPKSRSTEPSALPGRNALRDASESPRWLGSTLKRILGLK